MKNRGGREEEKGGGRRRAEGEVVVVPPQQTNPNAFIWCFHQQQHFDIGYVLRQTAFKNNNNKTNTQ